MANYLTNDTDLTAVANAIRTKGGTSAALTFPGGFVDAIGAIPAGSGGWSEVTVATAAANGKECVDILFPDLQDGEVQFACIKSAVSGWVTDQALVFFQTLQGLTGRGNGFRWRNSALNSFSTAINYDAKMSVGDVYYVSERFELL